MLYRCFPVSAAVAEHHTQFFLPVHVFRDTEGYG